MLRKSILAASAAFTLSAAAPNPVAQPEWAACQEVTETYWGEPVWVPVPTQWTNQPSYAGWENAGGSPVLGGNQWMAWGGESSINNPSGGSWGVWQGSQGSTGAVWSEAGVSYIVVPWEQDNVWGGNGFGSHQGEVDIWVTTATIHLGPNPADYMGTAYNGEQWPEWTCTYTNTIGLTTTQYGAGGGWEVWETATTASNGAVMTVTVTATTTATGTQTVVVGPGSTSTLPTSTTTGGGIVSPTLITPTSTGMTTTTASVSFTTTTISGTVVISPVTTSMTSTSTDSISFTTTTSSGTVVISPVTTSTSSSTTTDSTTISFTTTTSSGTVVISPITTSTTSISFTTTTISGTVTITPITTTTTTTSTSTSSTSTSTTSMTSMTTTTSATTTTSTTTTVATGPCATNTGNYLLQAGDSNDFTVNGNYAVLVAFFGTGYTMQFTANYYSAQQFSLTPNCTLITSDGGLEAMVVDGSAGTLHRQYFFPSVASAQASVGPSTVWDVDTCAFNADNTLTCTASGASIFQTLSGNPTLYIGDQDYAETLTINLMPVPGKVT